MAVFDAAPAAEKAIEDETIVIDWSDDLSLVDSEYRFFASFLDREQL